MVLNNMTQINCFYCSGSGVAGEASIVHGNSRTTLVLPECKNCLGYGANQYISTCSICDADSCKHVEGKYTKFTGLVFIPSLTGMYINNYSIKKLITYVDWFKYKKEDEMIRDNNSIIYTRLVRCGQCSGKGVHSFNPSKNGKTYTLIECKTCFATGNMLMFICKGENVITLTGKNDFSKEVDFNYKAPVETLVKEIYNKNTWVIDNKYNCELTYEQWYNLSKNCKLMENG